MPRFRHHTLTNGIAENNHYIFVYNIPIIYTYSISVNNFSEANMGVCGNLIGGGLIKIFWGNQWTSNEEEAKTKHALYVLLFSVLWPYNQLLELFPWLPLEWMLIVHVIRTICDRVGNTCSQHLMTRTWLHWASQSAVRVIALISL